MLAGNNINYRRNYNLSGLPMETFAGFQSRFDHIRVGLFNQTDRRRRETVKNNYIDQTNLGWFVQQEIRPTSWLRTQIGARMDNFWFDVDQIGEVDEPISGKGSATIVNPKLNFIFTPFDDGAVAKGTNLFLNSGGGFHSNDARVFVQDSEKRSHATGAGKSARSRASSTGSTSRSPTGALTWKVNWYLSATRVASNLPARADAKASKANFVTISYPG